MQDKQRIISDLNEQIKRLEKENEQLNKDIRKQTNLIERFINVYQHTTVGLYQTTPDGEIIYANNALVKMLGFKNLKEFKQRHLFDMTIVTKESRREFIETMFEKEKIIGKETVWYKKDGSEIYIRESANVIKNDDGGIVYFVGTVEDITLQKSKGIELEQSEKRYRSLVEFLPVGIVIHSQGRILYANNYFLNIISDSEIDSYEGLSIYDFLKSDYHELAKKRQQDIFSQKMSAGPVEMVFERDDGREIYAEVSTTLITFYGQEAFLSVFRDISTRKDYEEKLKISESSYKNILNSISEAVFIQKKDGIFININQTATDLFGFSRKELIGKTQEILAAPNRNNLQNIQKSIINAYNGTHQFFDFYGKHKDGRIITFEVSLSPGDFLEEKVVVAVVRDVSEQRIAEEKLVESERKYRELVDSAVGGIIVGDSQGIIIEANSHMCDLFGRKKEDIIGKHISEGFFTEESLQKTPFRFDILKQGKTIKNEREIQRPNGTKVWIEMHTKLLPNITYQSIYHDISDRKRAEKEILEAKKMAESLSLKRESLLKAIPDMMFSFDKYGYIIDYYSNTKDELYLPEEKFLRKNIMEIMPPDIGKLTMSKIGDVLKSKGIEKYTYSLEINGVNQHFDARLVYLDKQSTLAVVRNVTDRFDMIEELRKAKEKAEEGERLASAFLSNLSHEIKTPMNGILGFAELLKDEDLTINEKNEYIGIIENSGRQLIAILNDIVEISKIEAGVIKVNPVYFQINDCLADVYAITKVTMPPNKDTQLILKNNIQADAMLINNDKVKIQQIITNLLSNAIKFTLKGKVEFGYIRQDEENLKIFVKDTGIGIDKKFHTRIFQRFQQAENTEIFKSRGAGLGLSITKAYVEMLGGNIDFVSEQGKGSEFFVTIPINLKTI
jgi:PAS domain S-box-containing protein